MSELNPFLKLLRSRRFLIALATFVVTLVVYAIPDLKSMRDELVTIAVALALALIGGYTLEDTVRAGREAAQQPPVDGADQLKQLITLVIDELVKSPALDAMVERKVGATTQVINRGVLIKEQE